MTRAKVDEWLEAMAQTSICGSARPSPIPVRNVFGHWPELVEALDDRARPGGDDLGQP
jgi:hypothetical protein